MSVTVTVEIKSKPGEGDKLVALFKDLLPDTRKYDGCISIDLYRNQDDPDVVILVEQWESAEHHTSYRNWRQETGTMDALGTMIAAPPGMNHLVSTGV